MIEALTRVAGRDVSRETANRLRAFTAMIEAENTRQNLVSQATLSSLWERHIVDSAQLVRFEPHAGASWVDIGTGAGLPGIVLACLVEGPVTLVEPRRLRAEFLRETVAALGLHAQIEAKKAEQVTGNFDVITGRAVASLGRFFGMCAHLSTKKTIWALPKGRSAQSELAEAQRTWQGVFHVEQSLTDPQSEIIVGTGVRAKVR